VPKKKFFNLTTMELASDVVEACLVKGKVVRGRIGRCLGMKVGRKELLGMRRKRAEAEDMARNRDPDVVLLNGFWWGSCASWKQHHQHHVTVGKRLYRVETSSFAPTSSPQYCSNPESAAGSCFSCLD